MRHTVIPRLTEARAAVARLLGADTDECVFVPNATHGVNTVLRNLIWDTDDIIVGSKQAICTSNCMYADTTTATITYGAISRTIQYIADVPPHPKTSTFLLQFPTTIKDILDGFRSHLKSITRKPNQKIVAVIDGMVSNPGVLLPWEEMVKIAKEENVISVVDAAHCIGQQPNLALNKADPDFWISVCTR